MFPAAETAERREVIVGDVKFGKREGKRFAIVLRVRARSRHGPDIDNKRDIRLLQQIHEFRERPRRMSDGKDRGIHSYNANGCESAIIVAL